MQQSDSYYWQCPNNIMSSGKMRRALRISGHFAMSYFAVRCLIHANNGTVEQLDAEEAVYDVFPECNDATLVIQGLLESGLLVKLANDTISCEEAVAYFSEVELRKLLKKERATESAKSRWQIKPCETMRTHGKNVFSMRNDATYTDTYTDTDSDRKEVKSSHDKNRVHSAREESNSESEPPAKPKRKRAAIRKMPDMALLDGFFEFFDDYGRKGNRIDAAEMWAAMTAEERAMAREKAKPFADSRPELRFRPDAHRWLRNRGFEDVIITTPTPTQPTHGERTTVTAEYYTKLASEIRELESAADTGTAGKLVQAPNATTGLVAVNADTRTQAARDVAVAASRPRALDMGATPQGRVVDNQGRLDDQGHEANS